MPVFIAKFGCPVFGCMKETKDEFDYLERRVLPRLKLQKLKQEHQMPKPVKKPTSKVPVKKSNQPQLKYIRLRVVNGCKRCGGELELCAVPTDGFGYSECVYCKLHAKVSLEHILNYLQR